MVRTIMVIDGNQDTIDILQLYLEHEGYRSVVAHDGEEALRSISYINPDLIILDLMGPKLDELEVCRWIKAESQAPIVALTTQAEDDTRWTRLSQGVDD
jgi:DNA-binding response OmpR family regulator